MLIAFCACALLTGWTQRIAPAAAASSAQAGVASLESQDPPDKSARKDKKQKKQKKANTIDVANDEEPAPDEPIDPQADSSGRVWRFAWKQHPSVRYGGLFRLDVEAKLQEDGHASYGPVRAWTRGSSTATASASRAISRNTSSTRSSTSSPRTS